jgi:hypothetical protein
MLVEFPPTQGEVFTVSTLLLSARVALLAAAVTFAATTAMHGSERISLRVTPSVALSPADATINAIVEPNTANRAIEVVADSGGYFRRSEAELDGDRAPRANQFHFTSLPAGVYQIRVAVKGASGQVLGSAVAEIRVIDDEFDARTAR